MKYPPVTEADFESALRRGRRGEVSFESARSLYEGSKRLERALELFSVASKVRDRNLGRELVLSAHIHMITECKVSPPCLYCSLASSDKSISKERSRLTLRELTKDARYAVDRRVQSIVLVGGTGLNGLDSIVRRAVERVRGITGIDLAVDVGPSLSEETVEWMKDEKVSTVFCSIESINARVFADAKPGDSLIARLGFLDMLERVGIKIGNVVMNGLGSTADLLSSILYSARLRNLSYLYISSFHPVKGTPWAERRPASVDTALKVLAIARLALPKVHIGLAEVEIEDPGSMARTRSQLLAGAGNTIAGVLVYKQLRINNTELIRNRASSLGFDVRA